MSFQCKAEVSLRMLPWPFGQTGGVRGVTRTPRKCFWGGYDIDGEISIRSNSFDLKLEGQLLFFGYIGLLHRCSVDIQ